MQRRSFIAVLAGVVLVSMARVAPAADWELVTSGEPESLGEGIACVEKTIRKAGDKSLFGGRKLHLVFFEARFFTLKVIDLGVGEEPAHDGLGAAMKASFCLAGCNGGFFHPDFRPLGLMIADGRRSHRFETSKLLSGLVVADGGGLRLLRRAEFEDHDGITALLQSGPFLVDRGSSVAGLSTEPARRRTFLLWNGLAGDAGSWAMGLSSSMTLADLGAALSNRDIISEFTVQRALNMDGGSSSGLYFDRGAGRDDFLVSPFKRVRNLLGVAPRDDLR